MKKKIRIPIVLILIVLIVIGILIYYKSNYDTQELKSVKSEKQLYKIYNGGSYNWEGRLKDIICLPFTFMKYDNYSNKTMYKSAVINESSNFDNLEINAAESTNGVSTKDYSKTNIQVENVDEADITKTDGDYIYSISEDKVIITDVKDPKNISIASTISKYDGSIPEDLMLYNDKLAVIYSKNNTGTSLYRYSYNNATVVEVYDIRERKVPILQKSLELNEKYYTSRCINNKLYIISSGYLREKDGESKTVERSYIEDSVEKNIPLSEIKYLKDVKTTIQTLIAVINLDVPKENIAVSSYLMDISNAYVSESSIYLLDQDYEYENDDLSIKKLFGPGGIIGFFVNEINSDYDSGYKTKIYKFEIEKNGKVKYKAKNKIEGRTINQYSLDEKNGHLRIALYDSNGSRVAIFDEKLKIIGVSKNIAKGETMYSSRFMGDKVYLVTYRNMDPLFVIDLSNEKMPTVLGELKIPGYSTYLHPYDENHIIGIGMETEEMVNRNSSGKVLSTSARIIGMKMALFDVTNVNNPIQISQTIIGDRRTTSAILTNPKALLFSKERELIAIPVNNYSEDFEINNTSDSYSSIVNLYKNYGKDYIAEGYFVYKINLSEGFNLKGIIKHEKTNKYDDYYYYKNKSKLLRGLYIDENLYTVSEEAIKVNNLQTLELVDELKIKGEV